MCCLSSLESASKCILQASTLVQDAALAIKDSSDNHKRNSMNLPKIKKEECRDVKAIIEEAASSLNEASKCLQNALDLYTQNAANDLKENFGTTELVNFEMKIEEDVKEVFDEDFISQENVFLTSNKTANKAEIMKSEEFTPNYNKQKEILTCDICEVTFKTKANLKVHKKNIHDAVKVSCDICGFMSSNNASLKRHMKIVHSEEKCVSCDICDASFKGENYLKIHKQNIHNSIKVACELCGFLSSNPSALSKHIKFKHSKNRINLQCDKCEFSHWNKYTLQTHIQDKHGEMKFKCIICNHEATSRANLNNHERKVHHKKKYKCHRCEYSCLFKSTLNTHIQSVHEGLRHSCDECNFSSAHKGDLSVHKKVVHQGFRVSCAQCEYTTTKKFKLKLHIKNKHPNCLQV